MSESVKFGQPGGKPLKSDILGTRLDAFKSLHEHLQLIGRRRIEGTGGTGASSTVYEVPAGKVFFLYSITVSAGRYSSSTSVTTVDVMISNKSMATLMLYSAAASTHSVPLAYPMILYQGESIGFNRGGAGTVYTYLRFTGFEVSQDFLSRNI